MVYMIVGLMMTEFNRRWFSFKTEVVVDESFINLKFGMKIVLFPVNVVIEVSVGSLRSRER